MTSCRVHDVSSMDHAARLGGASEHDYLMKPVLIGARSVGIIGVAFGVFLFEQQRRMWAQTILKDSQTQALLL